MTYHRYTGTRCTAPGCTGLARGITSLCRVHDRQQWMWGEPGGHKITKRFLEPYRRRWLLFKAQHDGHPAIQAAVNFLDRLYQNPDGLFPGSTASSARQELRHQRDLGATGEEALDWLMALHLVWASGLSVGMETRKGRLAQLGYRVLHTKRRGTVEVWSPTRGSMIKRSPPIRRRAKTLRMVGKFVGDTLGPIFVNTQHAIYTVDEALATPFPTPSEQEAV